MQFIGVEISQEFRDTKWLVGDVMERLSDAAQPDPYFFSTDFGRHALYLLRGSRAACEYRWLPYHNGLLPPLAGAIALRKLGPLTIRARR